MATSERRGNEPLTVTAPKEQTADPSKKCNGDLTVYSSSCGDGASRIRSCGLMPTAERQVRGSDAAQSIHGATVLRVGGGPGRARGNHYPFFARSPRSAAVSVLHGSVFPALFRRENAVCARRRGAD